MKYLNEFLITGGSGMVGNSFKKVLPDAIYVSSKDCNLTSQEETSDLFLKHKPKYVIHLAARVGGVMANMNNLGSFYYDNVMMNTNVLECSRVHGVKKLISCLSTCIYPDKVEYPLSEDKIHLGPPHQSNYSYAYTKRMIEVQSRAYREQYGCDFICMSPNNLYGTHDNFDLENSHVIPAIIRKIYEAKLNNKKAIFWGDGTPLREFTYADDIPEISLYLLENYNNSSAINVGNTKEISIKQVVDMVARYFNFDGEILWDTTKPMGQIRKPSDNSKFISLGWSNNRYTKFEIGLKETCKWFTINYPNVRGVN